VAAAPTGAPPPPIPSAEPEPSPPVPPRPAEPMVSAPAARGLYGPPTPKAEKGRLPDLGWTPAPEQVPRALEEAIRITTRNYPTVKAAQSALRGAAAEVRTARWQRFPTVGVNVAFLDTINPEPELTVELPIFTGGRIGATIERAKAAEDSSSARYVETIESLALSTTQVYFQIIQFTRREQLLAVSLMEHRKLVGTMERRVQQEVSPLADLELARSRTAQFEQDYNLAHAQLETALRTLAELISDPAYELGPIPRFDPRLGLGDRETLDDEAQAFDPALRRLTAEIDVARAELDATKATIWPRLNGQYSYTDFYGSRVGVVARLQTQPGLSQFSQNETARLRVDSATELRRQAAQTLERQIDTDLIDYDAATARASISATTSETASRVALSYMRQFIAGRRSWLDVMNALREAVTAEIGKSDAEVTAMSASVRLLLRSGRWRPFFADGAN
jgi:adhesin transport system outer membrane protein